MIASRFITLAVVCVANLPLLVPGSKDGQLRGSSVQAETLNITMEMKKDNDTLITGIILSGDITTGTSMNRAEGSGNRTRGEPEHETTPQLTQSQPNVLASWSLGDGYPEACGADYIRNEVGVKSLNACLDLCTADRSCRVAAYNTVDDHRCGLYRSQCRGQTHTACGTSECYKTYQKLTTTTTTTTTTTVVIDGYRNFGAGYPKWCGTDFIRYEKSLSSLQACVDLCTAEGGCQFVAYNSVGDHSCGLYKSQCYGQTHTACKDAECYETFQKLTTTTTTTTAPRSYHMFGAGYPEACGADYIRNEVGVKSLNACLDLCTTDRSCRFAAYNAANDHRCGLYRSQCRGQTHTACGASECYKTYQRLTVYSPNNLRR